MPNAARTVAAVVAALSLSTACGGDADQRSNPTPPVTTPAAVTPPAIPTSDTTPARPLQVDETRPQLFTWQFKPSAADPAVAIRDEVQTAMVDTRQKPLRGKLVIALSGTGGAPGPLNLVGFAASLGFHGFAIAYENSVNPSTQSDPDFFGKMRFEQFDGIDRNPALTVARPDCVEVRVARALAHLQALNPEADWGYFLNPDGSPRWSDVIFIGHSHGATSAAAFAKLRRIWRAVSMSGPRDTNPVVATWLDQPSSTPIDRLFGFTGTEDPQYPDHVKAMEAMHYLGTLTDVATHAPPYGGSHRLQYPAGHNDSIDCERFKPACLTMLGVE